MNAKFLYNTLGPCCPHCGHEHQADEPFFYDEDMTKMECQSCEREFAVRVYRETSWSTAVDEDRL